MKKFNGKSIKPKKNGEVPVPKKGQIPEEYLTIEQDPMKNAAVQKSILPSLLVGLYDLGRYHSKCIINKHKPSKIMTSPQGNEVLLVSGEMVQRLNEMKGEQVPKDAYVAATCFVVSTEIFDYKKNTKQALKIVGDFDGHVSELVCWPNYFTGLLEYPKDLRKGNICTVFLKKRNGKDDVCSITDIVIEA